MRRAKEALVSTALKLQVAIKIAQDDELTISSLQQQLEHAKTKEIVATKQAEEAVETINVLRIELNSLRRRFQEPEKHLNNAAAQNLAMMQQHEGINSLADNEVDTLIDQAFPTAVPRDIQPTVLQNATPFDRWKMNEFLYTPNTPAASFAHDQHVVTMLVDAANKALHEEAKAITRPTKTTIAKMKRTMTAQSIQPNTMTANDFDILPGDIDLTQLSPDRPGTVAMSPKIVTMSGTLKKGGKEKGFYLNDSPEQKWGQREKFQHENMGRMNLWNTNTPVENSNNILDQMQQRKPSSVRLKSLRVQSPNPYAPPGTANHSNNSTMRASSPPPTSSKSLSVRFAASSGSKVSI